MRLQELLSADVVIEGAAAGAEITGITADSRAVRSGMVFAALRGANADGASFVPDAVASGAAAILIDRHADLVAPVSVPLIRSGDPRRLLALIAAQLHPRQPGRIVAVTGTSGKTSVAAFARQIFAAAGFEAASVGTIGVVTNHGATYGSLTTPDPVELHRTLDRLAGEGVTHLAIEASSHGLEQRRLDGVRLTAAGFTNLGRDHMDYHPTVEDYLAAKLRLFDTLLPPDGAAVVDVDSPAGDRVAGLARRRGQRLIRVGRAGTELRLMGIAAEGFSQRLKVDATGRGYDVLLPLAGAFQASNALLAAGLAIAGGVGEATAIEALAELVGAPGRLEKVGETEEGALVFVDYAHKPDALVSALEALRPFTKRRLVVVFGAGGDRDKGKRPLMGAAATAAADIVIVTDDNPRREDPAAIRRLILDAAPGAIEIPDRRQAIEAAIGMLGRGDVLCVAGKGHETGQIVGTTVLAFSDHETIAAALRREHA